MTQFKGLACRLSTSSIPCHGGSFKLTTTFVAKAIGFPARVALCFVREGVRLRAPSARCRGGGDEWRRGDGQQGIRQLQRGLLSSTLCSWVHPRGYHA